MKPHVSTAIALVCACTHSPATGSPGETDAATTESGVGDTNPGSDGASLTHGFASTGAATSSGGQDGSSDDGGSDAVPTWVPDTTWTWVEIPNTTFTEYMKDDGTGIAPVPGSEPGALTYPNYAKQTSFGGPAYSRKHHELYMFGGGHKATTLNALSRWNLGKDEPDMTLLVPPTDADMRAQYFDDPDNRESGYWPDGKPKSGHMYHALQFLDATDELLAVGIAFGQDPVDDAKSWNVVAGYHRGDEAWLPEGSFPALPPEPYEGSPMLVDAPTFASFDGSAIYYYRDQGGSGPWRRLDAATRTFAGIGGSFGYWLRAQGAARHDEPTALVIGGDPAGGGTGYMARRLDLDVGTMTEITTVGDPPPPDAGLKDLVWVSRHGYWIAWFTDNISDDIDLAAQYVVKIAPGEAGLDTTIMSIAGTPPRGTGGCKQGMFYDDVYDALIFVGDMRENLRIVRVD